jgi:hypothetical protein
LLDGNTEQSQPKTDSEADQLPTFRQLQFHNRASAGGTRVNLSKDAAPKAARAQWLCELNRAIDEAQWLAWRIGVVEGRNAQALELYVQLEMMRTEVEAMWPRGLSQRDLDTLRDLAASRKRLKE